MPLLSLEPVLGPTAFDTSLAPKGLQSHPKRQFYAGRDIISKHGDYWIYENRDYRLEDKEAVLYNIIVKKWGLWGLMELRSIVFIHLVTQQQIPAEIVSESRLPQIQHPTSTTIRTSTSTTSTTARPCQVSKTVVRGRNPVCEGTMIFEEEFEKKSLRDLSNWNPEIMFPREPDFPFNVYTPDNTISFVDGSLVIRAVLTETLQGGNFLYNTIDLGESCTGNKDGGECKHEASGANVFPPVLTAKISTRRSFNFKFGRIEVRAKLPAGSWLIPGDWPHYHAEWQCQFFARNTVQLSSPVQSSPLITGGVDQALKINLEPSDQTYGKDHYESGFMRVAFARGNPSLAKKLYGGPVLADTEPFRSALLKEKIGNKNWNKDYHNYTLVWRPDGIDLLVDGEQYGTVRPEGGFFEAARKQGVTHSSHWVKGTVMAPLDEMFHVTLGLRVGGINDFADDLADKPWVNRSSKARLNFWRQKDSWHPSWYNSALHVDYVRVYAL
ncbi:unnamed protein product [Chrysodeixis includens]|uniref:GH16 domain-containing protein n=1 Tax=Chrysodeixis includens TaxID=689277 RepID=A0A9N8KXD8_CHRIL|nr:unnamed protein product [Chrysodeixis includens]